MRLSEITPDWIRIRARTKGMRLRDLAQAIGTERTKLSKSLNRKRNFLGWELAKIAEVLGEPEARANLDPEITAVLEDYLALSEPDRARARALLRALLTTAASEGTPRGPDGPDG